MTLIGMARDSLQGRTEKIYKKRIYGTKRIYEISKKGDFFQVQHGKKRKKEEKRRRKREKKGKGKDVGDY